MGARHVLTLAELGAETIARLVDDSVAIAAGRWAGRRPLDGRVVGIYFKKTSTRTRTAFTSGAQRLGATTIAYGPHDLQINTGETLRDTGRVLENFLDALVVRTNEPVEDMRELAAQDRMPVINAMSDNEHPTQAIADLSVLKEAFKRLDGLHVLYVGEGNNTATAIALAVGQTRGMRLTLATPEGYGMPAGYLAEARRHARQNGASVEEIHDAAALPRGVDAVYTARWTTMGAPKADPTWLDRFRPFAVTPELMARVGKEGTVFMHDLPCVRGQDTMDEVLDGPRSVAFRQAYHKMTSAMAVLHWSIAG
jgi:ornithine carbamoyltransferase